MGYTDVIRKILETVKRLLNQNSSSLNPKEILSRIFLELEKRKKLGIEENAYVPNVYVVYLNPIDQEELSPFLLGIRDQLKNRIMERIRKKGYKLLSSSVCIEIREDSALEKNQVVVESSFLKEKSTADPLPFHAMEKKIDPQPNKDVSTQADPLQKDVLTRVVEEKKTKLVDESRLRLEILEGEGKGDVIALKEGDYTFGRGREAKILIKDSEDTISRVHFKVGVKGGRVNVKDLNSTNGTKVNGIAIEEAELKKGDTISVGKVMLKVA